MTGIASGQLYIHKDDLGGLVSWDNPDAANFMNFTDTVEEIVNHGRTFAHVMGAYGSARGFEFENLDPDRLIGLLRAPTSFWSNTTEQMIAPSTPADPDNPAPWYDPAIPASAEALGFWIVDSSGEDGEHHRRSLSPQAPLGSVVSAPYSSGRTFAVSLLVVATSEPGVRYLASWMEARLLRLGREWSGPDNLLFRSWELDIDSMDEYDDADEWAAAGLMKSDDVSLLSGPTYRPVRSDVRHVLEMTFTLGSTTPALLTTPTIQPLETWTFTVDAASGSEDTIHSSPIAPVKQGIPAPIVNIVFDPVYTTERESTSTLLMRLVDSLGEPVSSLALGDRLHTGVMVRLDWANRRVIAFDPWRGYTNGQLSGSPSGVQQRVLLTRANSYLRFERMQSQRDPVSGGGMLIDPNAGEPVWALRGATSHQIIAKDLDDLATSVTRTVTRRVASVGAIGVSGE